MFKTGFLKKRSDESDRDYELRLLLAIKLDGINVQIDMETHNNRSVISEWKEKGYTSKEIDSALKQVPETIVALKSIGSRVAMNAPSLLSEQQIYRLISDMRVAKEDIERLESLEEMMMIVLEKRLAVALQEAENVPDGHPEVWADCMVANKVRASELTQISNSIKQRATIYTKMLAVIEKTEHIARGLELSRKTKAK